MTNTFSTKSNAARAARKQGLDPAEVVRQNDAGAWCVIAPERDTPTETAKPEPTALKPIPDALAVVFANLMSGYVGADDEDARFNAMIDALTEAYEKGRQDAAPTKAQRKSKAKAPREAGAQIKRQIVADLLLRPEGTTRREILAATGWPAVSVPAIAKASGLTLYKDQTAGGGAARYYGSVA